MPTSTPPPDLSGVCARLLHLGLEGAPFDTVLAAFCEGLNATGLSITRVNITTRTNHPEFGAMAHRWMRRQGAYSTAYPHRPEPEPDWLQSPLYVLLKEDVESLHLPLHLPENTARFPFLAELKQGGDTDYIAFKRFFSQYDGPLGVDPENTPEGCVTSLATDDPGGFDAGRIAAIRALLPPLWLALKTAAKEKAASDIAETYLGRDAGRRVLSGDILRGSVQRIDAVICYFDLSNFTALSETLPGAGIVEMLNAYFEMAVEVVQAHGGNVLKFMGDGMLAVFDRARLKDADRASLTATLALRDRMAGINAARRAAGQPVTDFTLALHGGEVLYGNIGGRSRLDFTVIGPAVNTAARLSGMCGPVGQRIVISANVARPMLDHFGALVSLGSYRLRGVAERQELFTLD